MKLLYIMDPLCGWCYGNSANILRLEKEFAGKLEIEVLPGGMWIGDRARYQSPELSGFIRTADARLREITGVEMTEAYDRLLDDTSVLLDSEPGCRAIDTIDEINPSLTLIFARAIARARYIEGLDNTKFSTFSRIVQDLSLDVGKFQELYDSEAMRLSTLEIFRRARKYADSYPSMFLEIDEMRTIPISLMNYDYEGQKQEIEKYL